MVKAAHTRLFLDLDGVFFDFEKSAIAILGESTKKAEDKGKKIWPNLMDHEPSFFENLDLMPGADALWLEIRKFLEKSGQHTPIFLTGCPKYKREKAEAGKEACVKRHFSRGDVYKISVKEKDTIDDAMVYQERLNELLGIVGPNDAILILCRPDQKNFFSLTLPIPILLDDRDKAGPLWTQHPASIFIHHTSEPAKNNNSSRRIALSKEAVGESIERLREMKGGNRRITHRKRRM
jgi:hypothetical protein